MHKIMTAVGYILALVGLAFLVKHLTHISREENCPVCNLRKKIENKNRKGSRYGSNPVHY
jgi:hypothetical protein